MNFRLLPLCEDDVIEYKKDMQEAFQMGAESEFGKIDTEILPEKDIDHSLSSKGAVAYKAILDGKMVGGAIVVIDGITHHNHLDFLYVKYGNQSKGIGKAIWKEVEKLHSDTKVWETVTPYFEKRNIYFYINQCGFHAVELYDDMRAPGEDSSDREEFWMFRFEKVMM